MARNLLNQYFKNQLNMAQLLCHKNDESCILKKYLTLSNSVGNKLTRHLKLKWVFLTDTEHFTGLGLNWKEPLHKKKKIILERTKTKQINSDYGFSWIGSGYNFWYLQQCWQVSKQSFAKMQRTRLAWDSCAWQFQPLSHFTLTKMKDEDNKNTCAQLYDHGKSCLVTWN